MRRTNILAIVMLPAVLMALVGGYFLTRATTAANAAPANCGTWKVVDSPNYGMTGDELYAVSASSENDVWAVGFHFSHAQGKTALIEHWNGTQWKIVSSPDTGTSQNELLSVVALTKNDVWAVGYIIQPVNGFYYRQTLIEHWDGKVWSIVPSPNVANTPNSLNGITAINANDIWTVGSYNTGMGYATQSLIEQWNGTAWSIIPATNVGQANNSLNSIVGFSADNIWAVGSITVSSNLDTLVEHWDGNNWNIVASPSIGIGSLLDSVFVIPGTKRLWATGYGNWQFNGGSDNLIEEWNGTSWNVVASPNPQGYLADVLTGVVAISSTNAWAVGTNNQIQTITLHWDGRAWNIVASPNPSKTSDALNGATLIPGTAKVWSVGYRQGVGAPSTLTEFDC